MSLFSRMPRQSMILSQSGHLTSQSRASRVVSIYLVTAEDSALEQVAAVPVMVAVRVAGAAALGAVELVANLL